MCLGAFSAQSGEADKYGPYMASFFDAKLLGLCQAVLAPLEI